MTAERRPEGGFTLLEVAIALVLLGLSALALLELWGGAARDLARARERLADARLATLALDLAQLGLDPATELAPWLEDGREVRIERRPVVAAPGGDAGDTGAAAGLERIEVTVRDRDGVRFRLVGAGGAR